MTDDLFPAPDGPRPGAAPARRCRRHEWAPGEPVAVGDGIAVARTVCRRCGRPRSAEASRRGANSRRLGGDQERRIERVYGPTKIGERGDPVDHLGRTWKWQSKATRSLPSRWIAAISDAPLFMDALPGYLRVPMERMGGLYGNRCPVVVRSFVRQGVRTRDWMFVRGWDAGEWLGLPRRVGYYAVPGDWWLDRFGRDEESARCEGGDL